MSEMQGITAPFAELINFMTTNGDLAHLSLLLWATGSNSMLFVLMKENIAANRRFNEFVAEIAKINHRIRGESYPGNSSVPRQKVEQEVE